MYVLDNVAGMMYRPTSSGLLVPTSYQFGSNQIFQVKVIFILYNFFTELWKIKSNYFSNRKIMCDL